LKACLNQDVQSAAAPPPWGVRHCWSVLDTDWQDGQYFHQLLQMWRRAGERPRMLHYVGILASPAIEAHTNAELRTATGVLEAGFQRFLLEGGQVVITLCVGDLHSTLGELRMQADLVRTGAACAHWDKWTWKRLARLCRRGAGLHLPQGVDLIAIEPLLRESGFAQPGAQAAWHYMPVWDAPISDANSTQKDPPPGHCAVIGGGLAGASVARALAVRGWQVTVVDAHGAPAGGASGLPAGLALPHVSIDDNPRSRLTRAGLRLTHEHLRGLLCVGVDWAPTGALELSPGRGRWHATACWVRPQRLVAAWLDHPGIRFAGNTDVRSIRRSNGSWLLLGVRGEVCCEAQHLVLAGAQGSATLAASPALHALQAVRGVVSSGTWPSQVSHAAQALQFPVNGNGSFIPRVPVDHGVQWHCGATFEVDPEPGQEDLLQRGHAANLVRLASMLPATGAALSEQWDNAQVQGWSGTRCVTHDRLPLVGALNPDQNNNLWCSIGMGARGLTFAPVCAELLVAQMCGEPWPVEARLARSMRADRKPRTA